MSPFFSNIDSLHAELSVDIVSVTTEGKKKPKKTPQAQSNNRQKNDKESAHRSSVFGLTAQLHHAGHEKLM